MESPTESLFSRYLFEVEKALEQGGNINTQQENCTPLLKSLSRETTEIAKSLIESGADVNSVRILEDGHIRSPLVHCLEKFTNFHNRKIRNDDEWYNILKMLLEHGANPNQAETECGHTPLTKALYCGRDVITLTKTLIKYGADVNLEDSKGRLPLEIAIEREYLELIKLLLDEGAEFSIQQAFLKAIKTEKLKIIQLLIERGARVNLRSISGKTPLIYALEIGNLEIIQLLLDRGADVNPPDAIVDAHLNEAIKRGKIKIVKLLCQKRIDLGRSFPVKTAIDAKNLFILKYLIEMGADFKVIGSNGRTPLTTAVKERDFGLVKLLLDRGADVNQIDGDKKTAFSLAVATKNLRFAKYLEERGATIDCASEIKKIANRNNDWKIHFENLL